MLRFYVRSLVNKVSVNEVILIIKNFKVKTATGYNRISVNNFGLHLVHFVY